MKSKKNIFNFDGQSQVDNFGKVSGKQVGSYKGWGETRQSTNQSMVERREGDLVVDRVRG